MLALLQQPGSQVPDWLQITQVVLLIFQSLFIILGIIAAYYRFIREKPHENRLQPRVGGRAEVHNGTIYLQAKVVVRNNGQVTVHPDLQRSALEVFTRKVGDDDWTYRHIESVFWGHGWVRPEEEIEDQAWIEVSYDGEIGLMMRLYFATGEDELWPATEIVSLFTKERGISSDDG